MTTINNDMNELIKFHLLTEKILDGIAAEGALNHIPENEPLYIAALERLNHFNAYIETLPVEPLFLENINLFNRKGTANMREYLCKKALYVLVESITKTRFIQLKMAKNTSNSSQYNKSNNSFLEDLKAIDKLNKKIKASPTHTFEGFIAEGKVISGAQFTTVGYEKLINYHNVKRSKLLIQPPVVADTFALLLGQHFIITEDNTSISIKALERLLHSLFNPDPNAEDLWHSSVAYKYALTAFEKLSALTGV